MRKNNNNKNMYYKWIYIIFYIEFYFVFRCYLVECGVCGVMGLLFLEKRLFFVFY